MKNGNIEDQLKAKYQDLGVDMPGASKSRIPSVHISYNTVKKAVKYAACGAGIFFGGYFIKGCLSVSADGAGVAGYETSQIQASNANDTDTIDSRIQK